MPEAASKDSESMEDILQSIKRIIEDDSDKAAAKPAAKAEQTKPKPEAIAAAPAPTPAPPAPDVLELTQVVKDDGSVTDLPPLPKPAAAPAPAPTPEPTKAPVAATPPPKPPEPPAEPAPKPLIMEEGLVSDEAAQAAAAALKPIVEGGQKDFSIPHIPSSAMRNGNTVEDLVLEALKPMLKAWLDEHLPLIVQKIVEKEVRRIVTFHKD